MLFFARNKDTDLEKLNKKRVILVNRENYFHKGSEIT